MNGSKLVPSLRFLPVRIALVNGAVGHILHGMKIRWLQVLALLSAGGLLLQDVAMCQGPQTEAQRKQFEEIKTKAEMGNSIAQFNLGVMYAKGEGVEKDYAEALKWFRKAAEQGNSVAQYSLGLMYYIGQGVEKDHVEAYAWYNLAARSVEAATNNRSILEREMTAQQIAEGQKRTKELRALIATRSKGPPAGDPSFSKAQAAELAPSATGTGFFISEDGYLVTNHHVVKEGSQVHLLTGNGLVPARVVKVDAGNDLAVLKAEGKFAALPVASSRGVKLGATAATVGFPNVGLQGFSPKLAKGEIGSLAGAQDDPRHFQISAAIQPGNSGGALVDERGNVIGVVVAKLSQKAALATSGTLAENVNYAVKSSFLLGFLESLPEVAARLKEPSTRERKFEDVVKDVERATVLVLVY